MCVLLKSGEFHWKFYLPLQDSLQTNGRIGLLFFSAVALKDVLPSDHLRCWLLFVSACRVLCSPLISKQDIEVADNYLIFLRMSHSLYGPKHFTPNMHLHLHLSECILDYGPIYSFWCFAFERYNGILGGYHTNSKGVERQFLRKFLTEQEVNSISVPLVDSEVSKVMHNLLHPKGVS